MNLELTVTSVETISPGVGVARVDCNVFFYPLAVTFTAELNTFVQPFVDSIEAIHLQGGTELQSETAYDFDTELTEVVSQYLSENDITCDLEKEND